MKRPSFVSSLWIIVVCGIITHTLASCTKAHAQDVTVTNAQTMPSLSSGLQQIYDAATSSTNYGVAIGGGRSTTGQKNVAFAELLYNFTPSVGMLIGYDYLWTGKQAGVPGQANLVKGGLNLQADLHPLKQYGFTNFTVTPFGFALVASGNGGVSEIMGAGVKTQLYTFKGFNLNGGVLYEDRTGAGYWNGRYVGGFLAITRGF